MSQGKGWDLTSLRSLESAAEWLRKRSDAGLVLVVRGEDVAFAVDAAIAPTDAVTMVEAAMPEIQSALERSRQAAREASSRKRRTDVYEQNIAAGTSCGSRPALPVRTNAIAGQSESRGVR
jgi:hypothetical protein